MTMLPEPIWPMVVLALLQLADGILCVKPVRFVAHCFEDVKWPRRYWRLMPPITFAAAAGLVAGTSVPYLGEVTRAALVLYFVVAQRCTSQRGTSAGTSS
jgi:hypothetical protein